jgi:hypothetical protein
MELMRILGCPPPYKWQRRGAVLVPAIFFVDACPLSVIHQFWWRNHDQRSNTCKTIHILRRSKCIKHTALSEFGCLMVDRDGKVIRRL